MDITVNTAWAWNTVQMKHLQKIKAKSLLTDGYSDEGECLGLKITHKKNQITETTNQPATCPQKT